MTVVVAVEVSFKGSLSIGSFLGMIEESEDFSVRSRLWFLRESSESKSGNRKIQTFHRTAHKVFYRCMSGKYFFIFIIQCSILTTSDRHSAILLLQ